MSRARCRASAAGEPFADLPSWERRGRDGCFTEYRHGGRVVRQTGSKAAGPPSAEIWGAESAPCLDRHTARGLVSAGVNRRGFAGTPNGRFPRRTCRQGTRKHKYQDCTEVRHVERTKPVPCQYRQPLRRRAPVREPLWNRRCSNGRWRWPGPSDLTPKRQDARVGWPLLGRLLLGLRPWEGALEDSTRE